MHWPDWDDFPDSTVPFVGRRRWRHMCRKTHSPAVCIVKPVRTATVMVVVVASRRLHIVDIADLHVVVIVAFGFLDCTGPDFVAQCTGRFDCNHRLVAHRWTSVLRTMQHLVTPGDRLNVYTARHFRRYHIDRMLERQPVAVVGLCMSVKHTVGVMDHAVPSPNDCASTDISVLRRTPIAEPKASKVALRNLPPALRLGECKTWTCKRNLLNTPWCVLILLRLTHAMNGQ